MIIYKSNTLSIYDVEIGFVFFTLPYNVNFRQKIDIILQKVRCRHNVKPILHCIELCTDDIIIPNEHPVLIRIFSLSFLPPSFQVES